MNLMNLSNWKITTNNIINDLGYDKDKTVLIKYMIENKLVGDLKEEIYYFMFGFHRSKQLTDFYVPNVRFVRDIFSEHTHGMNDFFIPNMHLIKDVYSEHTRGRKVLNDFISEIQGIGVCDMIEKTEKFLKKVREMDLMNWWHVTPYDKYFK